MDLPGICSTSYLGGISTFTTGLLALLTPLYFIANFRNKGKPLAKYGKHSEKRTGVMINATLGWIVQESPSLVIPVILIWKIGVDVKSGVNVNVVLAMVYTWHYFYRTLIYPFLFKRGGQQVPLPIATSAFIFTALNGFTQVYTLLCAHYPSNWLHDARFITGISIYLVGLLINIHSDHILRNLRKPGETGYKIPRGGMFEYVSGANFFGEIVEWFGFAVACWSSLPAWVFAVHTMGAIGNRGAAHHRFYQEKFEDYPKNRKAVIPFIW